MVVGVMTKLSSNALFKIQNASSSCYCPLQRKIWTLAHVQIELRQARVLNFKQKRVKLTVINPPTSYNLPNLLAWFTSTGLQIWSKGKRVMGDGYVYPIAAII